MEYLTVRPYYAIKWRSRSDNRGVTTNVEYPLISNDREKLLSQLRKRAAYSGEMTEHSQRRMKKAVENLFAIAVPKSIYNPTRKTTLKFITNFITLTLPSAQGNISDKEIHSVIFIPWLNYAKRSMHLVNYVWKCERQQNGNIHYHLLSDCFIDMNRLQRSWNWHCNKLGLVDVFKAKHGHDNPPSTQIKAAQNSEDVARYIRKYLGKKIVTDNTQLTITDNPSKLNGVKCWDASNHLKSVKSASVEVSSSLNDTLQFIEWLTPKSVVKSEYYTLYKLNKLVSSHLIVGSVSHAYSEWLKNVKSLSRSANISQPVIELQHIEHDNTMCDKIINTTAKRDMVGNDVKGINGVCVEFPLLSSSTDNVTKFISSAASHVQYIIKPKMINELFYFNSC